MSSFDSFIDIMEGGPRAIASGNDRLSLGAIYGLAPDERSEEEKQARPYIAVVRYYNRRYCGGCQAFTAILRHIDTLFSRNC